MYWVHSVYYTHIAWDIYKRFKNIHWKYLPKEKRKLTNLQKKKLEPKNYEQDSLQIEIPAYRYLLAKDDLWNDRLMTKRLVNKLRRRKS